MNSKTEEGTFPTRGPSVMRTSDPGSYFLTSRLEVNWVPDVIVSSQFQSSLVDLESVRCGRCTHTLFNTTILDDSEPQQTMSCVNVVVD